MKARRRQQDITSDTLIPSERTALRSSIDNLDASLIFILSERFKNAGLFKVSMNGARDQDQHDRKLPVVTRHSKSLGDILVTEGLARTWVGAKYDRCA